MVEAVGQSEVMGRSEVAGIIHLRKEIGAINPDGVWNAELEIYWAYLCDSRLK